MKRILIIEDNDEVRENTAEILTLSGYEVLTAANGKEGVEVALAQRPDLIVCDIMMPVLDGYGVLHLLSKHEDTASIPFIFLTAKAEKADLRKGMEMGADDYLTKPFDGIELLNAIEVRLKKAAALKQKLNANNEDLSAFINNAKEKGLLKLTNKESIIYTYKKKHILYSEGQKPKAVYYIISGKVKVYKTNEDGKELITDMYTTGDFFGYLPVLQDVNYRDNAELLEDAEMMLIPREDFKKLITADAQTAKEFIGLMTNNMMNKEEDLLNLAYNTLRKKVAYGLVRMAEKYKADNGKETIISLSREDMAQSIGIATESLIRTLTDFKKEGLIDLQPGRVIILNENKLRNLPY
ncbi:response regulator [Ilyomonas limi]|uniref:Response regulator n=1 Tax=Ilyomonas limi TaxID=2575867 RepID=A0A4U3L8L0_9BACT|nr:response regulator [Ilyomonas limi]TKK70246.1 response regulator [Ilyomonas limi]